MNKSEKPPGKRGAPEALLYNMSYLKANIPIGTPREREILSYKDHLKTKFEKSKKVRSDITTLRPVFKINQNSSTSIDEVQVQYISQPEHNALVLPLANRQSGSIYRHLLAK